jgi:hypothetical protein
MIDLLIVVVRRPISSGLSGQTLFPHCQHAPYHVIFRIEHIGCELNALHEAPHVLKGPLAQQGGAHPVAFFQFVLHLGIGKRDGSVQ